MREELEKAFRENPDSPLAEMVRGRGDKAVQVESEYDRYVRKVTTINFSFSGVFRSIMGSIIPRKPRQTNFLSFTKKF